VTHRDRQLLWLRHAALVLLSIIMLTPFYWVLKTAITGENIFAYPPSLWPVRPHLFNFVDVWYLIPFPRYLLNSTIVSLMAVVGNLVLNALAGYALTLPFIGRRSVIVLLLSCTLIPFQATIIPAYLITAHLGLLNSWLGWRCRCSPPSSVSSSSRRASMRCRAR
jgi:ABC-type glycerol-3-phosphate transport system permease component